MTSSDRLNQKRFAYALGTLFNRNVPRGTQEGMCSRWNRTMERKLRKSQWEGAERYGTSTMFHVERISLGRQRGHREEVDGKVAWRNVPGGTYGWNFRSGFLAARGVRNVPRGTFYDHGSF